MQQQFNVTDEVSHIVGAHQLRFGVDYRRLRPEAGIVPYTVQYLFSSLSNVLANTLPEAEIVIKDPSYSDLLKLEPVRSGHMEGHARTDHHLWPAVGVQRRAVIAQWHSSVYCHAGE